MASKILIKIHQSSWFLSFQGNSKILGIESTERSWDDVKQYNQERDQLLVVTSLISRVLCIHMPVFKKQGLEELYLTQIVKMVHTVNTGMRRTTPLTIN